jgi:hypothetical protein
VNLAAEVLEDPDFVTGDYLVTRQVAPSYAANLAVAGATSTFQTGPAFLRPAAGLALKLLPEGHHAQGSFVMVTTAALQVGPVPDQVATERGTLVVVAVHPWTGHGGTHYVVELDKAGLP